MADTKPTTPTQGHAVDHAATPPRQHNDLLLIARTLHRALHGRYPLAIALALLGALVFGGLARSSARPVYRSEGLIRIAPVLPHALEQTDQNAPIANFDGYMQSQRATITSRTMVELALQQPHWRDTGAAMGPQDFADRLNVELRPRTDFMRVQFEHRDPAVAAAAVSAIITAYEAAFAQQQEHRERQRLHLLQARRDQIARDLALVEARTRLLAEPYGSSDLSAVHRAAAQRLAGLEDALAEVRNTIALARIESQLPDLLTPAAPDAGPAASARFDQRLRHEQNLERAQLRGLGEAHPEIIHWRHALAATDRRIEQLATEYAAARARDTARALAAMHAREQQLLTDTTRTRNELLVIGASRMDLEQLHTEAGQMRKTLADISRRIDVLQAEGALADRLSVISRGDVPMAPQRDRGRRAAVAAACLGAALLAGPLVIAGLLRPRYRRAALAAGDFTAAPVFTTLPALKDGETQTPFALAAANALHDLRLKLAINATGPGGRNVCLITSATPGEGATSLALGIALSFAAARTRTLLIDFNLADTRLTCGFTAETQPGLREVLAGASLADCAVKTRGGLSILFAGAATQPHAPAMNLARMQQLLSNARREYDMILLDGGPILAGPEASLLARSADGVVLAIARDQEQHLVRRAAEQLRAVGSRLAAVVFNHADPEDFARASCLPGAGWNAAQPPTAVPASPQGESHNAPLAGAICRLGPLAGALVASLADPNAAEPEASADGTFPRNALSERRKTDRSIQAA